MKDMVATSTNSRSHAMRLIKAGAMAINGKVERRRLVPVEEVPDVFLLRVGNREPILVINADKIIREIV